MMLWEPYFCNRPYRWFAWRPIYCPDAGHYVWLEMVWFQFSPGWGWGSDSEFRWYKNKPIAGEEPR